ncbi:MAG: hypothetical protein H7A46_11100 [Verrucomicrobiales bacterium]|nr:hypothetical protein [Verrucomicrobiales bacterium]
MRGLLYLITRSLGNRLRVQFRRLRKPQYLIGTVVGLAYFWFFFMRPGSPRGAGAPDGPAWGGAAPGGEGLALVESGIALLMLVIAFLVWLLPVQRAALGLTEGEVAFLFPAPVSRRTLIRFHLLRAQLGLLFTALIMVLVWRRRSTGWEGAALGLGGWWLMMVLLELHRQTAAFVRTWLADRGIGPWRRRGFLLAGMVLWVGAEALWLRGSLPELTPELLKSPEDLKHLAGVVTTDGPLGWVLLPARWIVRPLFAAEPMARMGGMAAQLVLCGLFYLVLMRLNVPIEEETLFRSQQRSQAIAHVRSGNWHLAGRKARARKPWFRLRPTGAPWVALCWKNLIALKGFVGSRFFLIFLPVFLFSTMLPLLSQGGTVAAALAMMLVPLSAMLLIMGPHMLRCDLRQDLQSLDVLKPLPLRGWQVLLGEVLAPALALTVLQWALLALFAVLGTVAGSGEGRVPKEVMTGGLPLLAAVGVFLPAFNLMSVLLLNGVAVLFPAWQTSLAGMGGRGFGVMGSQLLLMLGHLLGMGAMLLAPVGAGAAIGFGLVLAGVPWPWSVLPATLVGVLLLLGELAGGLLMLGDRFERLDAGDEPVL